MGVTVTTNNSPAPTTQAAIWGTSKTHGNPGQLWYFGPMRKAPATAGRLVNVVNEGSAGMKLVDPATGLTVAYPAPATRYWAAPVVQADPADVALVEAVHPGLLAKLEAADQAKAARQAVQAAPALEGPEAVATLTAGTADRLTDILTGPLNAAADADDELILTTAFLAALDVVRDRLNDRREAAVKAAHAQGATYAELGALVGLSATRIARMATGTGRYVPKRDGGPAFTMRTR